MPRAATISIFALLLLSTRAIAQQTPAMGAIEGTVVRSDSGDPVAGAQVTLTGPVPGLPTGAAALGLGGGFFSEASAGVGTAVTPTSVAPPRPVTFQPVTTGADGKFSFKDLNAGTYRVAATGNGFVRQEYGQRTPNGQGRPIFITAGQTVKDAAIRLIATGTVSGRVFDENGQPATGSPIQLLRPVYNVQGRNYQSVGTGNVDDRGDYRVYGVPPGRYYLVAGTPPGPVGLGGRGGGPVSSARFSMVYYPNAADFDSASTIEVKPGAEASFDMRVRRQIQGYRVRGRIADSTGAVLPANLNVALGYRSFNGGGSFSSGRNFDPATNTFELQNVAPGDYTLQVQLPLNAPNQTGPLDAAGIAARQAEQASRPSASVPIRVVDSDIEGVVLTLSAGVSTTGRIVVEGQPISSVPNLDRMRLGISFPTPGVNQTPPIALPASADGTFQVMGLREGEYRVQFAGLPGFYVKSIQYGGDDILTRPLKFGGSGSGTFEVTLRQGASQLNGTVTDARSQPVAGIQVVLIPGQRTRSDLYRNGITDQNGKFSLTGLAPGEYKLFGWEALDNGAQFDPDFLKQYEQQGKAVQVAESSNQNVEVKLIPAP